MTTILYSGYGVFLLKKGEPIEMKELDRKISFEIMQAWDKDKVEDIEHEVVETKINSK